MTVVRKTIGVALAGALVGAMLGLVAPSRALANEEGCKCTDDAPKSTFKCKLDHSGCTAGTETCFVQCTEVN